MEEIRHTSRRAFGHQTVPMPADDIHVDPDYQQVIYRLGVHGVGEFNSREISRVEYVTQVASAVRRRRQATAGGQA
jgi:hypothetical protein